MNDVISRQAAIDILDAYQVMIENGEENPYAWARLRMSELPSAQPDSKELSFTQKKLDTISRQAVIEINRSYHGQMPNEVNHRIWKEINELPSAQPEVLACGEGELIAQPEIIRCKDCKHWTQTTGNMCGFGLGDCDYINAKLVNCNGFCYWAERRTDESD